MDAKRYMEEAGEKESLKISLSREDSLCRSRWIVGIDQIASGLIRPSSFVGDTTVF